LNKPAGDPGFTGRSGPDSRCDKVVLHKILKNRTYRGMTVHKTEAYPGQHEAIIDEALWNEVRSINREPPRTRARLAAARDVALLRGLIFGPDGWAMTPQHARNNGRLYRYYVSMVTNKRGENDGLRRVPAGPIDQAVIEQIRRLVRAPEIVARRIRVRLRTDGLRDVIHELQGSPTLEQAA
jgi:site-specific DNA recombinase